MIWGKGPRVLLCGAGIVLLAACGGGAAEPEPDGPTAGAEAPRERTTYTFNDYRGTWHGMATMASGAHDVRALLLVVDATSELCERPAHGCVPAEVRVEGGHLVFRASRSDEGGSDAIEGRVLLDGPHVALGSVRSSRCSCTGEARLDRYDAADETVLEGTFQATISFDPVAPHETRALPVEFRSPEPFTLHIRAHGAEACSEGEGGCVHVELVRQGPQVAFRFERIYPDGMRVTTAGHVGRTSSGRLEGEVRREGGEHTRIGRIYLREDRVTQDL